MALLELEVETWSRAQQFYSPDQLRLLLVESLDSFKRSPGLDAPVRLHVSTAGAQLTRTLWELLHGRSWALSSSDETSQLAPRLNLEITFPPGWSRIFSLSVLTY